MEQTWHPGRERQRRAEKRLEGQFKKRSRKDHFCKVSVKLCLLYLLSLKRRFGSGVPISMETEKHVLKACG